MAPRGRFEKIFVRIGLWIFISILGAGVLFMAFAVWDVREKELSARQDKELAESQFNALQERYDALSARRERLETPRGIEEELRERFLVAKEGEEVIILVDAPPTTLEAEVVPRKSMWDKVFDWLSF